MYFAGGKPTMYHGRSTFPITCGNEICLPLDVIADLWHQWTSRLFWFCLWSFSKRIRWGLLEGANCLNPCSFQTDNCDIWYSHNGSCSVSLSRAIDCSGVMDILSVMFQTSSSIRIQQVREAIKGSISLDPLSTISLWLVRLGTTGRSESSRYIFVA